MSSLNRRHFLASGAVAAAVAAVPAAHAQEDTSGGFASVSLRQALEGRQSTRVFGPEPIAGAQLLDLLWAANGVNRPDIGGRTAPAWRTSRDIAIYVAQAEGVLFYEPDNGGFSPVSDENILGSISATPFVGEAPLVLIYVSDREAIAEAATGASEEALTIGAHVNAALIAQNVYLFAAAEGLGTCLVGSGVDHDALATALGLSASQSVVYVQPVGHPV